MINDFLPDFPFAAANEWFLQTQALVQQHPGRKQIRLGADRQTLDLFGRHVTRGAHHGADARPFVAGAIDQARHTKIGQLDPPIAIKHDIGGLDVAVDDAIVVRVVQRLQ